LLACKKLFILAKGKFIQSHVVYMYELLCIGSSCHAKITYMYMTFTKLFMFQYPILFSLRRGDSKLVTSTKVVPSKSVLWASHKPKFIHFFLVIDITISQIFWHSEGNTGTTTFIFICFIKLKRQRKNNFLFQLIFHSMSTDELPGHVCWLKFTSLSPQGTQQFKPRIGWEFQTTSGVFSQITSDQNQINYT